MAHLEQDVNAVRTTYNKLRNNNITLELPLLILLRATEQKEKEKEKRIFTSGIHWILFNVIDEHMKTIIAPNGNTNIMAVNYYFQARLHVPNACNVFVVRAKRKWRENK